jgi:hypothetical protein
MKTKQYYLKTLSLILPAILLCLQVDSQKAVFLHHSTGGNVYKEGNVNAWITDYNKENNSKIELTERAFPNKPYKWKNYPFDYWNLWVNGACDSAEPGIVCMKTLSRDYRMIIFKHCFPGAQVLEDTGNPDIKAESKSLENYKVQYRALREMMDQYPDNIFVVWTLVPLHRLSTTPENAQRAKEFVKWVDGEWLTEDGKSHDNILIFDFWGLTAEKKEKPGQGQINCLRYEYERSHESGDSHPNTKANEAVGPIFAKFIADVLIAK